MRCARAHGAGEGSAALVPNPGSADGDGHALHALQGVLDVFGLIRARKAAQVGRFSGGSAH